MYLFQDLPKPHRLSNFNSVELGASSAPTDPAEIPIEQYGIGQLTMPQWGVIISMCWTSMSCFFILGSWESNIPIFTAAAFNYTPYAAGNFIALGGIATLPFLLASVRYSPRFQDRTTLATGSAIGLTGLVLALALLATDRVVFGSFYVCWVLVALGFNLASTCTLSLLSKQMPNAWNGRTSIAIQYSNYCGRVTGAILGGAGTCWLVLFTIVDAEALGRCANGYEELYRGADWRRWRGGGSASHILEAVESQDWVKPELEASDYDGR
jgi:MFS family permease